MKSISRRRLIAECGAVAVASTVLKLKTARAAEADGDRHLRILVAGGHPGDPEAGE